LETFQRQGFLLAGADSKKEKPAMQEHCSVWNLLVNQNNWFQLFEVLKGMALFRGNTLLKVQFEKEDFNFY